MKEKLNSSIGKQYKTSEKGGRKWHRNIITLRNQAGVAR